jgi:predicted DNA-binding transcriptional regulator AlpA
MTSTTFAHQQRMRLPARQVWARFGITDRTLDRWLADENLKFPRPLIINRRRYFFLDEIEAWERVQAKNSKRSRTTAAA